MFNVNGLHPRLPVPFFLCGNPTGVHTSTVFSLHLLLLSSFSVRSIFFVMSREVNAAVQTLFWGGVFSLNTRGSCRRFRVVDPSIHVCVLLLYGPILVHMSNAAAV